MATRMIVNKCRMDKHQSMIEKIVDSIKLVARIDKMDKDHPAKELGSVWNGASVEEAVQGSIIEPS